MMKSVMPSGMWQDPDDRSDSQLKGTSIRYLQAVNQALDQEMRRDEKVVLWGEDIRRNLRGASKDLLKKYGPKRVVDLPISEQAFTGMVTGAAMRGLRPVVEYQLSSMMFLAMDQMANQAQKLRYMMGGQGSIPVTYLFTASGARQGLAGQHSDSLYAFMIHAGIKTVLPATPYDAKGLLAAAIREDDPVAVFAPVALLPTKGEVPDKEYIIPLGQGDIKREGKDVTIVATGQTVIEAIEASEELSKEGISVEVFDPRSLLPLDKTLLLQSVRKTGRAVIVDDTNRTCGFGGEIAAILAEECFRSLMAPIKRITRADTPIPYCLPLENYVLPSKERVIAAIKSIL